MLKSLGYFIVDGKAYLKTITQIEILSDHGHQVEEITEEEYYKMYGIQAC